MFDVIVIGGGPAGVTAALRARELGAEVALVERAQLGGTCTNDGCWEAVARSSCALYESVEKAAADHDPRPGRGCRQSPR